MSAAAQRSWGDERTLPVNPNSFRNALIELAALRKLKAESTDGLGQWCAEDVRLSYHARLSAVWKRVDALLAPIPEPAPGLDPRTAESIALIDAIGPLLTGKDHLVIISVLSALIRSVAVQAFKDRGIAVSKLMEIVMRHAQPREIDLRPDVRH